MKSSLWTIGICILLVAAIGVYTNLATKRLVEDYLLRVNEVTNLIRSGDHKKAGELAAKMKEDWLTDCQSLQAFAFHQDTNKVDSYLYMLEAGLEYGSAETIIWALHELEESFDNIYSREDVTLVNIF